MSGEQKTFWNIQFIERGIKLRENLTLVDTLDRLYRESVGSVESENAALKESLAELIKIADYYHDREVTYTDMPYKNWTAAIDRAKKLIAENRE